jgi:CheY-like chemotaxis protein
MTGRLLSTAGWEVREAGDGRMALQRLAEQTPTVIVLDLLMPELDGFNFIREVRNTPAWRDIPVVVITAKDVSEDDRHRLNGYVKKILHKGAYKRNELLIAVREQLRAYLQLEGTTP